MTIALAIVAFIHTVLLALLCVSLRRERRRFAQYKQRMERERDVARKHKRTRSVGKRVERALRQAIKEYRAKGIHFVIKVDTPDEFYRITIRLPESESILCDEVIQIVIDYVYENEKDGLLRYPLFHHIWRTGDVSWGPGQEKSIRVLLADALEEIRVRADALAEAKAISTKY